MYLHFLPYKLLVTHAILSIRLSYDSYDPAIGNCSKNQVRSNKSLVIFRKSSRNATFTGLHCKYLITIMQSIICWVMKLVIFEQEVGLIHPFTRSCIQGSHQDCLGMGCSARTPHEIRKFKDCGNWYEVGAEFTTSSSRDTFLALLVSGLLKSSVSISMLEIQTNYSLNFKTLICFFA